MSKEIKTDSKVDLSKYIVNIQGRDFITLNGLVALGHEKGVISSITEWVNTDVTNPVFKTTVTLLQDGREKTFTGYGDANVNNVAKKVAGALIRMSESRSISRALRFACNIDMVALEELDSEENTIGAKVEAPKSFAVPKTFGTVAAKVEPVQNATNASPSLTFGTTAQRFNVKVSGPTETGATITEVVPTQPIVNSAPITTVKPSFKQRQAEKAAEGKTNAS